MEEFEEVVEQYDPMITSLLKRANIYKNHDQFRQSARIALWNAWQKYDPARGPFAPFAYRSIKTSIFSEMTNDNRFSERQIAYEKETLTAIAQIIEQKNNHHEHSDILFILQDLLTEKEYQLIIDIYFNGYNCKELTKKYGTSAAALRKRKDRALKKVREKLMNSVETDSLSTPKK
ncbi:sigma-70 family RNA polymerase sigma factor [Ureibacillus manganicus]|uniref:sigma-70 family RNA polymerase sigma factor n=1 Tax=Ureibacillus manganicus TaxID=1266064 RepID=UPI000689DCF0|nr:sigma-70 family RNA polymerase sigma factor [Ureibacillus manganicus]